MPSYREFLYIGFADDPDSETDDLMTDVSAYLLDGGNSAATRRGRQAITQKVNPGTGVFLLDNSDGMFDALNFASPFYGLLHPMKLVKYGLEYPFLPGLINDGAVRDHNTPDEWVETNCVASWAGGLSVLDYGFMHVVGSNTSAPTIVSPPIAVPASRIGESVTMSAKFWNDTAGTRNYKVGIRYYSDAGGTTLIGTEHADNDNVGAGLQNHRISHTRVVPATTVCFRMVIGDITGTYTAADSFYVTQLVADFTEVDDFQNHYVGYTDGFDCSGDVGDDQCVVTSTDMFKSLGLTPMNSPLYGEYLRALGADAWFRFNETTPHTDSVSGREVRLKDEVSGDRPGKIAEFDQGRLESVDPARASNGNLRLMRGLGPLFGIAGCSPLDTDFGFSVLGPSSEDVGILDLSNRMMPVQADFSYNWWMRCSNGQPVDWNHSGNSVPVVDGRISQNAFDNLFLKTLHFYVSWETMGVSPSSDAGKLTFQFYGRTYDTTLSSESFFGLDASTIDTAWYVDAEWHMFTFTFENTAPEGLIYVDGVLDTTCGVLGAFNPVSYMTVGGPKYDPHFYLGSWNDGSGSSDGPYYTPLEFDEFMLFDGRVLTDTEISDIYVNAKVLWAAEPSMDRIDRAADLVAIPGSKRALYLGNGHEVTAVRAPFAEANPLTYMQQVEDTEQGLLFINKSQGQLQLVTHYDLINRDSSFGAPLYTFGNGPGEMSYESVTRSNNDELLYTEAVVTIVGGPPQRAERNVDKFRKRTLQVSNILSDDNDYALAVASTLASLFGQDGTKLGRLVINPMVSEDHWLACSSIELGMQVNVRVRFKGLGLTYINGTYGSGLYGEGTYGGEGIIDYVEVAASVQEIVHSGQRGNRRITYGLSSIYAHQWMQFGDDFGTYDMSF